MGIVWETYHKGVPLLGVPENPTDLKLIGISQSQLSTSISRTSTGCSLLHDLLLEGEGISNYCYLWTAKHQNIECLDPLSSWPRVWEGHEEESSPQQIHIGKKLKCINLSYTFKQY